MEEVLRGRCHALAMRAHECARLVDEAKSALALVRPSTEHTRKALAEGA